MIGKKNKNLIIQTLKKIKVLCHCMIIAYSLLYFKVVVKQNVPTVCLHLHKRLGGV